MRPRHAFFALTVFCLLFGCMGRAAAAAPDSWTRLRQLFPAPPAEFSTLPFLVWNGEVTEADIDLHLAEFKAQGIHGVFIHPRPGMITPYLSDRWFQLCRYTVEKGKKLGMEVWLYDENSYPSGFAGGHVPAQMPESYNQGQGLALQKLAQLDGEAASKFALILKKTGDGFTEVTAGAAAEAGRKGEYYCFERVSYGGRAEWFGGFSYVDLIKPGVTEKFIEITMRGYEKTLAAEFGRALPGIFTDEPNVNPPRRNAMRWTPDLFEQFQKRWGYDLKPRVVSLFEEVGEWRKVRHNYYALLLQLFIDRWAKPWKQYTEKQGIQWTGHYWEHAWPNPGQVPDNMAMYAWFHVPGIDMLFNQFSEEVSAQFGNARAVKELASVANQVGQRRTLSETYGGAGWELRFEDMKRLGEWEYVLGVNMMNQHLSFQTLAGARKHDYPQSFTYHEPWWKHYHALGNHFARLSLALSSGQQVNSTLVIEPTSSAWLYASPGQPNPRMMELGRAFQAFVNQLEAAQMEYDLGSENIIKDRGKAGGGRFTVGQRSYSLVVLPPGFENLDSATAGLLADYLKTGGKVLAFVDPPPFLDGAENDRVKRLAAQYAPQWTRAQSPADEAAARLLAGPEVEFIRPNKSGKLFHQRRKLDQGQLLFLVNASLEEPASGTVKVKGKSAVQLDPQTGKITPFPAGQEGGRAAMAFELPPAGSLLLFVGDVAPASRRQGPAGETPAVQRELPPATPLAVKRLSPNALTLDFCDLKLDGAIEKDVYYYNAADKVFKRYGFEAGNPWGTAVQYKTSILDRNKFPADSGFEATFHFEVAGGVDKAALQAIIERPEFWKVSINGRPVERRPGAWWLDHAFGVFDIGRHVVEGDNAVTLAARPMSVHNELEPIYLLGDFGLESQGRGWRAVRAASLKTGPWKEQALPFYSDRVSYSAGYRLGKTAGRYKVRLGKWQGTVAEVLVNGKPAGIIGWQPYELDITDAARATGGEVRVEVIVYGSLKNLLGPHHGKINRGLTSPQSFRTAPPHMPAGTGYDLESYGLLEDFKVLEYR